MRNIALYDIGLTQYEEAWRFQEQLFHEVIQKKLAYREEFTADSKQSPPNYFILCEHHPVITLGTSGNENHLLINKELLKQLNITFVRTNRGGDITYHGPGQIVGYPILDLDQWTTDIHQYMRMLEEVIIRTIADYGLSGQRLTGATGVWLDVLTPHKTRKICAMGVRTSRWVTMHGFALNVNTNLSHFNLIIPCGIADKQVTSLQQETGRTIPIDEVKQKIIAYFSDVFSATLTIERQFIP